MLQDPEMFIANKLLAQNGKLQYKKQQTRERKPLLV